MTLLTGPQLISASTPRWIPNYQTVYPNYEVSPEPCLLGVDEESIRGAELFERHFSISFKYSTIYVGIIIDETRLETHLRTVSCE
jgi:hypothetical protein